MSDRRESGSQDGFLLLEDGHFFLGEGFGYRNDITVYESGEVAAEDISRLCGELCFNTGMAGYQETLSDPSYAGQMICFSFPHIGNVGCNREDNESRQPHALAMISREYPEQPSNWRSESSLETWLQEHRISGICGPDTRALIRHLREGGSQRALLGIVTAGMKEGEGVRPEVLGALLRHLQARPQMTGLDLASRVSSPKGKWRVGPFSGRWLAPETRSVPGGSNRQGSPDRRKEPIERPAEAPAGRTSVPADLHVVALDLGMKENIFHRLRHFAARVSVLPLGSTWEDLVRLRPDGLFLSNGPGDPEPAYRKMAPLLNQALAHRLPTFGICLGHQILALSLGARTVYMHHGHRGSNHPVLNLERDTVEISSQNHGFSVEEGSLPQGLKVTHRSLFDSSIEGFRSLEYPVFAVQYHPESSPGPHDSNYLFCDFVELMEKSSHVF